MSHVRGSFFFTLFLPNDSSINNNTEAKSTGGKCVSISIMILINFGLFLSGYESDS